MSPRERLRHHVTGAIERGEKTAITEMCKFRVSTGVDLQGDACLYFSVLNRKGDHVRYATEAELARVAELLATVWPEYFDATDEASRENSSEPFKPFGPAMVWALYSDDDGVVLFSTKAAANKTKRSWDKAGSDVAGPFGPLVVPK